MLQLSAAGCRLTACRLPSLDTRAMCSCAAAGFFLCHLSRMSINRSRRSGPTILTGSMLRTAWLACLAGRVAGEMYLTHNCDAAGCRCNVGFYAYVPGQADFTGCTKCPAHATTNGEGSAGLSDCVCRPGFTPPVGGLVPGGVCVRCAVDTYKDTTGNDDCTACPSDSTTLGTFGAATRDICQCNADFEGDLSDPSVDCVQCASTHETQNAGPEACVAIADCAGLSSTVPAQR